MDRSETARKAKILAKGRGYITFDQLNQILPPNLQSEEIESLMSVLNDNEIGLQGE